MHMLAGSSVKVINSTYSMSSILVRLHSCHVVSYLAYLYANNRRMQSKTKRNQHALYYSTSTYILTIE